MSAAGHAAKKTTRRGRGTSFPVPEASQDASERTKSVVSRSAVRARGLHLGDLQRATRSLLYTTQIALFAFRAAEKGRRNARTIATISY